MDYIAKVFNQMKKMLIFEFIQAVEEVSLRPVIEAHPEYEKQSYS